MEVVSHDECAARVSGGASAFRGRERPLPFRADFSEATEATIDATLRGELPGILVELLALRTSFGVRTAAFIVRFVNP